MEFTNTFHVPLPMDQAWTLMLDVPRILPCLPGARLTEVLGDNRYRGSVSVKLGPIKLAFDGQAELVRTDEVRHIAWLQGAGLDPKGRGSAQSEFSFALTEAAGGHGTDVTVTTQLQLSGAVAQYGRGSGMIAEVAGHILKQFEENLAESLQDEPVGGVAVPHAAHAAHPTHAAHPQAPAGMPQGAAPPDMPMPSGHAPAALPPQYAGNAAPYTGPAATPGAHDLQTLLYQAQAMLGQSQAVLAATQQALLRFEAVSAQAARRKPPKELNMLSIGAKAMWSQTKAGVGRLFGR